MKKLLLTVLILLSAFSVFSQTQTPGLDILGYGYDVFGNYADQSSKKRYNLFTFSNFKNTPIGSDQYSVPEYVILENISKHMVTTVSGESIREYAQSQASSVGLSVDALFFSGSINSSYSSSSSGSERRFYYTYRDANTKWRISFDERNLSSLKNILDPAFKRDLQTMDPAKLFATYGTHYIASAYLGGRADYNSVTTITQNTKTSAIAVAVEAEYHAVSGNATLDKQSSELLSNSDTKTKLTVTGGNSEYANNISTTATYEKWASGIASMPVLCDFDENSLKPIWDFAETAGRRAELKSEFDKMIKANPLPEAMAGSFKVANKIYFIRPVSQKNSYIDIPGYHFLAEKENGTPVKLWEKDNPGTGLQGIDRFIKIIPHGNKPEFVFLQPQHSDLVLDAGLAKDPGGKLQLWTKGDNNENQMFKLIEVDGLRDTYYIQNANSGLYLTETGEKSPIILQKLAGSSNQQWKFENANGQTDMAPFPNGRIALMNVKGKKYIDIPGSGLKIEQKGALVALWDMDFGPDRYMNVEASVVDGYSYLTPMHGLNRFHIQRSSKDNGARLQLWEKRDSDVQQFKFIYAGSPMTFYVEQRASGKFLDAADATVGQNGCPVTLWDKKYTENQQWKVSYYPDWSMPDPNQKFYIKAAYTNYYWDISGSGAATNQNGAKFAMWEFGQEGDRIYKIKSANFYSWVNFEVQNGGRYLDVPGNTNANKTQLQLWDNNNGNGQKFAIQPTSRNTFVLRTMNWKAVDIKGGSSSDWKKKGAELIIYDLTFRANQQFVLVYADGPHKGNAYVFDR